MKSAYVIVPTAIVVAFVGIVVALQFWTGPTDSKVSDKSNGRPEDDQLESIREALKKAIDFEDYRGCVQLFNSARSLFPEVESLKEKQSLLSGAFNLDEGELAEVNHSSFTALDAHYLDLCLMVRDALRSMRLDKLNALARAAAGFGWVVRQVQYKERPGDALPPDFVLRRGYGTANERALIFMAVLQQLGTPGCMIALPGNGPGDTGLRYWIPGALIDKQIYLFDTRLGLPLPGPKGRDIATLAQIRSQPELLKRLTIDSNSPYDVAPEQTKTAEIHVGCFLNTLAPRMRALEELLAAGEGLHLGVDPAALLQGFQAACQDPKLAGTKVRIWNLPGDLGSPIRVLRNFVPEDEGGVSKSPRRQIVLFELVPRDAFPDGKLVNLAPSARDQLLSQFATPFVTYPLEARITKQFVAQWLPGFMEGQGGNGSGDGQEKRQQVVDVVRERMPRDLVLHGLLEVAPPLLVAIDGELKRQKRTAQQDASLDRDVASWCEQANRAYTSMQQAARILATGTQRKGDADSADLESAKRQIGQLWQESGKIASLLRGAAAEPLLQRMHYLLALCKQEQAERAQRGLDEARRAGKVSPELTSRTQDVWRSTQGLWNGYLQEYSDKEGAAAARWLDARALYFLNQPEQAAAVLELASADLPPLQKTAHLYLARQLKGK